VFSTRTADQWISGTSSHRTGSASACETASVCTWAIVYKFERALAELYTTSKAVKAKIRSLMVQYTPDTIACACARFFGASHHIKVEIEPGRVN
jgi:hypothetical protein